MAAQLSSLSAELTADSIDEAATIHHALQLILELIPDADSAALAKRTPAKLSFVARTGTEPGWLETAQVHRGQGPCHDAVEQRAVTLISAWSAETRWPDLLEAIARTPAEAILSTQSVICVPLGTGGHPQHCLMLCSSHAGGFDGVALHMVTMAAASLTLLLTAVERSSLANHLSEALDSNRRIGVAMGILVATTHCDESDAFTALRQVSQTRHRKLRDVADEVIYTGTVPPPVTGHRRLRPA